MKIREAQNYSYPYQSWKADPLTHEVLTTHIQQSTSRTGNHTYYSHQPAPGLHDDLKAIGWQQSDLNKEFSNNSETARTTNYYKNGQTLRVREIHDHDPMTDWAVHVTGS